jgi:methionyl-tRNA synthetase
MNRNYYITTTLPYVNADPHIDFALEIVQADAIARYRRLLGDEVFFNTGTDEHGQKIFRAAEARRTQDIGLCRQERSEGASRPHLHRFHPDGRASRAAAQKFWRRCKANRDIYKKAHQVKYCVAASWKTDSNSRRPLPGT